MLPVDGCIIEEQKLAPVASYSGPDGDVTGLEAYKPDIAEMMQREICALCLKCTSHIITTLKPINGGEPDSFSIQTCLIVRTPLGSTSD
jgi:hypothetical protein